MAPRHTTIVILRSPSALVSPNVSRTLARVEQTSVAQLAASIGVPVLARTTVPNALTLKLTAAQAHLFSTNPFVAHVLTSSLIPGPSQPRLTVTHTGAASAHGVRAHASCGTAAHPQLNPEALGNINAPGAWSQGATGTGIKVAFLADGVDPTNPDLQRNAAYASAGSPTGSPVITSYQDFSGDGTAATTAGAEAFGDAGSIASQGNVAYDLSTIVNPAHPLPAGCDIKIVGSAPGSSLVALKIFAASNFTTGSGFIQAINYAVQSGVKVINESFGGNPMPDTSSDLIRIANDAAVAAGVTVVVSSGDAGISSTIGSPSTDPKVLSVGATTTFRSYQQDTFGGINMPGASGGYIDNNISSLSSGGFAQNGKTVNLVAPGDLNWSLCSPSPTYAECFGAAFQNFGGTSESAPLTSGAAADVIGAYAATHHGSFPSPATVGHILTSTAKDIYAPATQQGAGLLNIGAAVALARSIKGTTAAKPAGGLLSDTSQINITGAPSSKVSKAFKLTNTGTKKVQVKLSTRGFVLASKPTTGTVTLDPSVGTSQPKFIIWSGASEIYQKATFTVKPGVARLVFQSAYQDVGQTSLVHVALFDPSGNFAGYSLPQGLGDYAEVEVAQPKAGKWTAGFFTVWDGYGSGNVGSSGPVPWSAASYHFGTSGTVTPSAITIPAGGSAGFTYKTNLSSTAGDTGASIAIKTATSATTIPVTLRSMIVFAKKGGGHFSGVLTGGNGRSGGTGQLNTYTFTVPSGKSDLDVGVALAPNSGNAKVPCDQLIGLLVDPYGSIAAYDANYTLSGGSEVCSPYLNLYKSHPAKGNWSLVLQWAQPGTGTATSVGFTGSVEFNQVSASNTLPHSSSTTVPVAGQTFGVTVHNTGVAPMILSPDARSTGTTAVVLSDLFGYPSTASMPNAQNYYYVPTETSSYNVTVTGTIPLTFDTGAYTGDPDISPAQTTPYVTSTQSPSLAQITYSPPTSVSAGLWYVAQAEIGPFSGPEPSGTETTVATVQTRPFDAAVTSTVTDTVKALTQGSSISPAEVAPGSSVTIPITITPTASVGTTVSGTLFINGFAPGSLFGLSSPTFESLFTSDLAAIPYTYKVGP